MPVEVVSFFNGYAPPEVPTAKMVQVLNVMFPDEALTILNNDAPIDPVMLQLFTTTEADPLLRKVPVVATAFIDEEFIFIVPVVADIVKSWLAPESVPATSKAAAIVNPPPAAADVPPPTKVAVILEFVISATSVFWSMVTVKLLE
ncbi:MAG: hypothetical protein EBY29_07715 [Planctomycetes bacterium]|nr:hypothetical protein [Planctomycetota bacterium]